jgi:FkbM family methyltransferase
MSELLSQCGVPTVLEGRPVVVTRRDDSGCVLYGPYVELSPGQYEVEFEAWPSASADQGSVQQGGLRECCYVDIACDSGQKILKKLAFTAGELTRAQGKIKVSFTAQDEGCYEFRFYALGTAALTVGQKRKLRSHGGGIPWRRALEKLCCPAPCSSDLVAYPEFVLRHQDWLGRFVRHGAKVTPTDEGAIVEISGVRLDVQHRDDLHVMTEIFLNNEYGFANDGRNCVIDIGMNVAVASLFFASLPNVECVHGFEPFPMPYNRAMRNIALNPALAPKITAHPFALGGQTETVNVQYDGSSPIGVSVRGSGIGDLVSINIRDAADVLLPILAEAEREHQITVLKMDCEGSEFPIIERLFERGLLPKIGVAMIEWHKWWSHERTQRDIMEKLIACGFSVFDRTQLENPHAGLILAVRN